jgi:hypothetical protein
MKVCYTVELKKPTIVQMTTLIDLTMPDVNMNLKTNMIEFIQSDMRKLQTICKLYNKNKDILNNDIIRNIFELKSYNDDTKKITQKLINNPSHINDHLTIMNETDRTIVGLLWHENIIDVIGKMKKEDSIPFYLNILDNMCFADYIDRITFQNQIWQFNEMSSLMKTFYNNKLYHDTFPENRNTFKPSEVRFTKVLTKYSTEYNNMLFIYNLSQELDLDKKDLLALFQELRLFYGGDFVNQVDKMNSVEKLFEDYDITKLDIKRMYRYLDKNVKKDAATAGDDDLCDDFDE